MQQRVLEGRAESPDDSPSFRRLRLLGARLLGREVGRLNPVWDETGTPEYSNARDAFVEAIEECFDRYKDGRFQADRKPIPGTDDDGYEYLTLREDSENGLPRIDLEINRNFIDNYYRGDMGVESLPYREDTTLARYKVSGKQKDEEKTSYEFTLGANKKGIVNWWGFTDLATDYKGRPAHTDFPIFQARPVELAAQEIRALAVSPIFSQLDQQG